VCAEDGLLRPKRERRSRERERSHRSRSRDRKRSRRSRSRERRGGSKSRRGRGDAQNGQVLVKQELEDVADGEYGATLTASDNDYYNQHAGRIDPANY